MAFGRLARSPGALPMSDINMTPLIDVMLVLLVIFMITAPLMTSSLKLDIAFDGTIFWNGEQIEPPALDERFKGAATMAVQPEFHLRPNKLVTYKHVAHVMAAAQRDGITKIGLVGAEQFLD